MTNLLCIKLVCKVDYDNVLFGCPEGSDETVIDFVDEKF